MPTLLTRAPSRATWRVIMRRVAGHGRQHAHLALALAAGPVERDGDLGDACAEPRELDQQLGLAREAALADQGVAVLGVALAQDQAR